MNYAVWGLGRLGLPLATVLTRDYVPVYGYDKDEKRVEWCIDQQRQERAHGINTIDEEGVWVTDVIFAKEPPEAQVNYIVVPTPSRNDGEFDSFYVEEVLREIVETNKGHVTAVIISTVFPGTCERLNDTYGDRLTIVYNPTFIALGTVVRDLTQPGMLLIGVDEEGDSDLMENIWDACLDANSREYKHVGTYIEAELLKLSINCALATKISLANQLGQLFQKWGVDPAMVSAIGADPRIGNAYMMPGVPISGPCLPRDNKALQLAAHKVHMRLPLSEATEDVDFELRMRLYNDVTDEIGKGHSVGILGMTYKYGVPLDEGSVGSWLKKHLEDDGYRVVCFDEWLPSDSANDTLACDVVVVTHLELSRLSEQATGEVIHVWS